MLYSQPHVFLLEFFRKSVWDRHNIYFQSCRRRWLVSFSFYQMIHHFCTPCYNNCNFPEKYDWIWRWFFLYVHGIINTASAHHHSCIAIETHASFVSFEFEYFTNWHLTNRHISPAHTKRNFKIDFDIYKCFECVSKMFYLISEYHNKWCHIIFAPYYYTNCVYLIQLWILE